MPKNPTNPALSTRRVFPMGFSVSEYMGVRFLAFTWRPQPKKMPALTFTEEMKTDQHDPDPIGAAISLKQLAARIERRADRS